MKKVIAPGTLASESSEQQGQANVAHQGKPRDFDEPDYHEEVVCQTRNAVSPDCRPSVPSNECINQCSEDDPRIMKRNSEETVCSSQSQQSLHRMRKQELHSEIVEHDQEGFSPALDVQVDSTEDRHLPQQSYENEAFKDVNGASKAE